MSSLNNQEHNKRVVDAVIKGNKALMKEQLRKEKEHEAQVLLDGITYMDSKTPTTIKDGEKKFQKVLNYYNK